MHSGPWTLKRLSSTSIHSGTTSAPWLSPELEASLKRAPDGGFLCGIEILPSGLLDGARALPSFFTSGQKPHYEVTARVFQGGGGNLRELYLWGNHITELDEYTFAGLWNLKKLDLDRNRLTALKQYVLSGHLLELPSRSISLETPPDRCPFTLTPFGAHGEPLQSAEPRRESNRIRLFQRLQWPGQPAQPIAVRKPHKFHPKRSLRESPFAYDTLAQRQRDRSRVA